MIHRLLEAMPVATKPPHILQDDFAATGLRLQVLLVGSVSMLDRIDREVGVNIPLTGFMLEDGAVPWGEDSAYVHDFALALVLALKPTWVCGEDDADTVSKTKDVARHFAERFLVAASKETRNIQIPPSVLDEFFEPYNDLL